MVYSLEVFPCLNLEDLNFSIETSSSCDFQSPFFFKTQKPHKLRPWFPFFPIVIVQGFLATPAHTLHIFIPARKRVCKCAKLSLIYAHSIPLTITPKFSCLQACASNCAHTLKDRILNSTNALTLVGSFERSWSRWSHHQFEPTLSARRAI